MEKIYQIVTKARCSGDNREVFIMCKTQKKAIEIGVDLLRCEVVLLNKFVNDEFSNIRNLFKTPTTQPCYLDTKAVNYTTALKFIKDLIDYPVITYKSRGEKIHNIIS